MAEGGEGGEGREGGGAGRSGRRRGGVREKQRETHRERDRKEQSKARSNRGRSENESLKRNVSRHRHATCPSHVIVHPHVGNGGTSLHGTPPRLGITCCTETRMCVSSSSSSAPASVPERTTRRHTPNFLSSRLRKPPTFFSYSPTLASYLPLGPAVPGCPSFGLAASSASLGRYTWACTSAA